MRTAELADTFLLNAAWHVAVVALLGWLGAASLRRAPARLRHLLWLAALVLGFALPLVSLFRAKAAAGPVPATTEAGVTAQAAPEPASVSAWLGWLGAFGVLGQGPSAPAPARTWHPGLVLAIGAVFMALVLYRTARLLASWIAVRRLQRGSFQTALAPEAAATLERCRRAFGLGEVEVRLSGAIASPLTFGLLRPVILVPERFFQATSEPEQTAALGHEAAHIARRDYALNLLAEVVLLPLAFHPAAWYLRRRLAETREMACDEATIERLLGARVYARSLLSLAALGSGLARPTPTLGVFDAGTLEVRMRSMMDVRTRMGGLRARLQLSLAALALVAAAFFLPGFAVEAVAGRSDTPAYRLAGAGIQAPASPAPAAWLPFLGTWAGEVPIEAVLEKDGTKKPLPKSQRPHFADVEIAWVDGAPRASLTLFKVVRTDKGLTEEPTQAKVATQVVLNGNTLSFRIHNPKFELPDGRLTPTDSDWEMERTGPSRGSLHFLRHSHYGAAKARGEAVPPPPPPLELRKVS